MNSWRKRMVCVVVILGLAIAGVYYNYISKTEVWREVYRSPTAVWSFNARSLRPYVCGEGENDRAFIETWLLITNRERGYYDRIRVQLATEVREYRFTDSFAYSDIGELAEL